MSVHRYIWMGVIALVLALMITLGVVIKDRNRMEKKWMEATENVKAYSDQYDSSKAQNRMFKMTIDQLKYSNDSIFRELDSVRSELKVKDSKLRSLQYVASDFSRADTITLTDTIFRDAKMDIDTLLSDEWYSLKVGLKYPSRVTVKPEFKSTKYIVVSAKRETVNPPKKFFLLRWFQRKYTVLSINVVERNPYVQNQSNRFVEIVR